MTDKRHRIPSLTKTPTGIVGMDEITHGGLPRGRPTLICGGPGCGKTIFGMEFLCRGALRYEEPGLFVSFEERPEDIEVDIETVDIDLRPAKEAGALHVKSMLAPLGLYEEAGEFTLDGLLVRLDHWVRETGARRLVLDSIDSLFSGFHDREMLRQEIGRVFRWVRERELTALVTAERGNARLSRHGLEEYLSDCVILLDHRVSEQISKRRLRIVKYRGSDHGTDEYPFLISEEGISVVPITSVGLSDVAPDEFISTGIEGLDGMLDGKGFYRASTVVISGAAGSGKSTIAARIVEAACETGKRCLYLPFEESAAQIVRDMRSVGIDLARHLSSGLLRLEPVRPNAFGLEEHLIRIEMLARETEPEVVVVDPISGFAPVGGTFEIKSMFIRLFDALRTKGATLLLPSLTLGGRAEEHLESGVSSLADAWIIISYDRISGRRIRKIYVHKARGLAHSEEVHELVFSRSGPSVRALPAGEGKEDPEHG